MTRRERFCLHSCSSMSSDTLNLAIPPRRQLAYLCPPRTASCVRFSGSSQSISPSSIKNRSTSRVIVGPQRSAEQYRGESRRVLGERGGRPLGIRRGRERGSACPPAGHWNRVSRNWYARRRRVAHANAEQYFLAYLPGTPPPRCFRCRTPYLPSSPLSPNQHL